MSDTDKTPKASVEFVDIFELIDTMDKEFKTVEAYLYAIGKDWASYAEVDETIAADLLSLMKAPYKEFKDIVTKLLNLVGE